MIERVPCVAAILTDSDGRVLLIQRDAHPGVAYPGWWTLPGGRVEPDETPDAAIRRELIEELGHAPVLTYAQCYDRPHRPGIVVEQHIYIGQWRLAPDRVVLGEGQAFGFFSHSELQSLSIAYAFDTLLIPGRRAGRKRSTNEAG